MSSIRLRDLALNQTNIVGRRTKEILVDSVTKRYKIDKDTRQKTEELEGYSVDIVAVHGMVQTVKLPVTCAETVAKIKEALDNKQIVKINFGATSTLTAKPYALINNGVLVSGVSCNATEINIVSMEDDDYDSLLDDIEY